jgi:hypothetical protein
MPRAIVTKPAAKIMPAFLLSRFMSLIIISPNSKIQPHWPGVAIELEWPCAWPKLGVWANPRQSQFQGVAARSPLAQTTRRPTICRLILKTGVKMGSARASRAGFRALAENIGCAQKSRSLRLSARQMAGREARPATPGAGVLPNSGFQASSGIARTFASLRFA